MTITFRTCNLLVLLPLLYAGCIVEINTNNYRSLKRSEKKQVVPFDLQARSNKDSAGRFCLQELNAGEVKNVQAAHAYTWVHLWIPYCKGPSCHPPYYYDRIRQKAGKDVALMLVSRTYDYSLIARLVERSSYPLPVYVVSDARYGRGMPRASFRFARELTGIKGLFHDEHLIFRKDTLIYSGPDMTPAIMDSVLALR